jgi:hypothetical protein
MHDVPTDSLPDKTIARPDLLDDVMVLKVRVGWTRCAKLQRFEHEEMT